jgi:hypothetical protein
LYDIANILCSLHLIEKVHHFPCTRIGPEFDCQTNVFDRSRKSAFRWIGTDLDSVVTNGPYARGPLRHFNPIFDFYVHSLDSAPVPIAAPKEVLEPAPRLCALLARISAVPPPEHIHCTDSLHVLTPLAGCICPRCRLGHREPYTPPHHPPVPV